MVCHCEVDFRLNFVYFNFLTSICSMVVTNSDDNDIYEENTNGYSLEAKMLTSSLVTIQGL